MRKPLLIIVLFILPIFCFAQEESGSKLTIRAHNAFRWVVDEARISISTNANDRFGYSIGWIHPNNIIYESLESMNSNLQLKYSRKGYLLGGYVKPSAKHSVYINLLLRNTSAAADTHIEITSGGSSFTGRDTYVERDITSLSVFFDYRKRIGKGRLIHEFYGGFGMKFRNVVTEYEDQNEFNDKIVPLNYDNGNYATPTIHVGYNIGIGFIRN